MNSPPSAAAALLAVAGGTLSDTERSRDGGLKVDQGSQTLILEPAKGTYVLRLARDCPFDEISPAYLVLFVHRLCALCPGIDIAHRIRCGHPIVASLPMALSAQATPAEWHAALAASLPLLEAALGRQSTAAESFHEDRPRMDISDPWPAVEVSRAQLKTLAGFVESPGVRDDWASGQEQVIRLREHLDVAGLLDEGRDWTAVLLRPELGMGFLDELPGREMAAAQAVAILNAIVQGARHSETLPRRVFGGRLWPSLWSRIRVLAA